LPNSLQKASSLLVLVTAATALAGYARELVTASRFGAGEITDAFFLTLPIVQTVVDLIFTGTLVATVVPLLSGLDRSAERSRALATITALVVVAALVLGAVLGY
jgi:peptidoglycan biosynthesis protein MviN/MurJ (putative lipid II flippase)